MGACIGYGKIGVWTTNGGRDAFLDWYAAHRCQPHDSRWEYCMSGAHRWPGCCIELDELIPHGELFTVSDDECTRVAAEFSPHVAQLLRIISRITQGDWKHLASSTEAMHWQGR
jgi:hypothetical protein